MVSARRRHRSLDLRPTVQDSRNVLNDSRPELLFVRFSPKTIQEIQQRLEPNSSIARHVFEMRSHASELARPQIIGMAFPGAPGTYFGLLFEAMLSRGRDDTLARQGTAPLKCCSKQRTA